MRPIPFGPVSGLARAAVVVFAVAGLTLAAHRLDDVRMPSTTATAPPSLSALAPDEEESVPGLALARAPRRGRASAPAMTRAPVSSPVPAATVAPNSPLGVVVSAPPPITPVTTAFAPRESSPRRIFFAAVPHAGLTQQTP